MTSEPGEQAKKYPQPDGYCLDTLAWDDGNGVIAIKYID